MGYFGAITKKDLEKELMRNLKLIYKQVSGDAMPWMTPNHYGELATICFKTANQEVVSSMTGGAKVKFGEGHVVDSRLYLHNTSRGLHGHIKVEGNDIDIKNDAVENLDNYSKEMLQKAIAEARKIHLDAMGMSFNRSLTEEKTLGKAQEGNVARGAIAALPAQGGNQQAAGNGRGSIGEICV